MPREVVIDSRTKYAYDRNSINDKWHNVIITYTSSEASDSTFTDSLSTSGMMNIYFDGERVLSNELGEVNNKTFDKVFTIGANPNQNGDYVYIYPSYKWFKVNRRPYNACITGCLLRMRSRVSLQHLLPLSWLMI